MLKACKRLLVLVVALCLLLGVGYLLRRPLLSGAANAWIVNDPPLKADVIVVPGGGLETRPFEAAKLYHEGLGKRILIMNPKPAPTSELGLIPSDTELTREILTNQGVPECALVICGTNVANTYDEAIAFKGWAMTNGVKSAIITTDGFHTRRVRWLFRKELKDTDIQVRTEAVQALGYTSGDWWGNEHGVIAFQNEVLKFAYYRLKY